MNCSNFLHDFDVTTTDQNFEAFSSARPRALRALGLACFGHSRALGCPYALTLGPSSARATMPRALASALTCFTGTISGDSNIGGSFPHIINFM